MTLNARAILARSSSSTVMLCVLCCSQEGHMSIVPLRAAMPILPCGLVVRGLITELAGLGS